MAGHIAAMRTGVPFVRGKLAQAAESAHQALALLPASDLAIRGYVTMVLGLCLDWQGQLDEAERVFQQALEISQTRRVSHISLLTLCNLASAQKDRGRLFQAADTFREAIALGHTHATRSGQPLPVTGYAYVYLGDIQREWNDLDVAQENVERGLQLCIQWGEPELLTSAYLKHAVILASVGDRKRAHLAIQNARRVAQDLSSWYAERVDVYEADLLLALGERQRAARIAERLASRLRPGSPSDLSEGAICLVLVKLAIAQGQSEWALAWTQGLLELYRSAGSLGGQIRTLVQQSIAWQAGGHSAPALASLQSALALAEPERFVRVFVESGKPLAELLHQALSQGIAVGFVRALLDAGAGAALPKLSTATQVTPPLLDPLTERELQVLRLLPTHLSSTEIAEQLYISKNTVRSHIGHIYDKLGVHSRKDAVLRAQELGLV
jgi:LuxR family maltose regulon positive regulatory protein